MTYTKFGDHSCHKVLAKLDSYIDNELLTESNMELQEHFESCKTCTQQAEERRKLRARLQTVVREAPLPPGLEDRVRDRLRESQRPPGKTNFNLMAIAAAVALCVGSWVTYQLGPLRLTTPSQESHYAAISARVATVMSVGLGDHLHCALIGHGSDHPKTAVDKLPPELEDLLPIVRRHVPPEFPLILAHECHYRGRKFVHLTFRGDSNLLSLVIARKQDKESLANLPLALSQSGIPMYTTSADRFQVAAFESEGFLVYTVSDLPQRQNLDILVALAPAVQTFLHQIEV